MAIFDVFKKKKEKKPEKKKVIKAIPKKVAEPKLPKKEKKVLGLAWKVLKAPHVTEKASDLAGKNQYVFKIWPRSNRKEVKRAVEDVFGVDVISVRIINVPKKSRRIGKTKGERSGYKKAIVRVAEGQKIEILPR